MYLPLLQAVLVVHLYTGAYAQKEIIRDETPVTMAPTTGLATTKSSLPIARSPFPPIEYTCVSSQLPDICTRNGLLPYTSFMFPNRYSETPENAGMIFSVFLRPILNCPQLDATIWLCLAFFPACPFSDGKPMCREFCMGIENSCNNYFQSNLVDLIDCSIYPDTDCVTFGGNLIASPIVKPSQPPLRTQRTPEPDGAITLPLTTPSVPQGSTAEVPQKPSGKPRDTETTIAPSTPRPSRKTDFFSTTFPATLTSFTNQTQGTNIVTDRPVSIGTGSPASNGTNRPSTDESGSSAAMETSTSALPSSTSVSPTTSESTGCQDVGLPEICSREELLDYSNVSFPNTYSQNVGQAGELFSRYLINAMSCLQPDATIWLCMAFFPACPNSQGRPMCRHFCEGVESACRSPFGKELRDRVNCSIYPDDDCISYGGSYVPPAVIGPDCTPVLFQCGSGECIPSVFRCDNSYECPDGNDERDCPACRSNEFLCSSGECVRRFQRCDGSIDCVDGSDEPLDCCDIGEIQCGRECFDINQLCDGTQDCVNGEDEEGCPTTTTTTTIPPPTTLPNYTASLCRGDSTFLCNFNRQTEKYTKCLPCNWVCDDFHDCIDGSDESAFTCERPEDECKLCQYKCTNGNCINKILKCNGVDNCGDNSDEDSQAQCPSS